MVGPLLYNLMHDHCEQRFVSSLFPCWLIFTLVNLEFVKKSVAQPLSQHQTHNLAGWDLETRLNSTPRSIKC